VNITVLDINDNVPMWRGEPYHANVVEMSPKDTDVLSVSPLRESSPATQTPLDTPPPPA